MLALSTYCASGVNDDVALAESAATVKHAKVRGCVEKALQLMRDPEAGAGISSALAASGLFDAVYARMLAIGARTGSIDHVFAGMGETFFNEASDSLDQAIDSVEPLLAALLTLAVGATLLSVMLPLVGIMNSIG